MNDPKICLFIPTFQVAGGIRAVLENIPRSTLDRLQSVFIIDNQSDDGTFEEIQNFLANDQSKKFRFYLNKANYSLGGSTILAFQIAQGMGADFVICMHSDGQADPADLIKFIDASRDGVDFVFGSRFLDQSLSREYSTIRRLGNRFFSGLQTWITQKPISDLSAFISFNLKTVFSLPYDQLPHDMGYHPILVLTAFRSRPEINFREFPIHWGAVETSNINIWAYGLMHLCRIISIKLGRLPLKKQADGYFQTEII